MVERFLVFGLALGLFACHPAEDTADTGPVAPTRTCEVTLTDAPPTGVSEVDVAGTVNDWEPQPLDDQGDGTWSRRLGALQPGTYGYELLYDGTWQTPPRDEPTTWNDDVENRALVVGDCHEPDLEAVGGSAGADGSLRATFRFTRAEDGSPLDPFSVTVKLGNRPASEVGATIAIHPDTGLISVAAAGLADGKYSVHVHAADLAGRPPEHGDGFLPLWVEATPYSWESGVLYFVFTDRFADAGGTFPPIEGTEVDGTNYLGGDLVGARQKLDDGWFDDLGVRSIWLSPVYDNPEKAEPGSGGYHYTGYHGYWPIEPRQVEERFGTDDVSGSDALKQFVQDAHTHGIRVVLDLVLNHVHEDHPYVAEYGLGGDPCVCTTDPGPCNWDTNPLFCWFADYLPDIDYRDQRMVDQMVSDVLWWTQTYDVDGFRIDAAKHMDHVIMRTLRLTLRHRYEDAGGTPFYVVGETFTGQGGQGLMMNYVSDDELSGQFDFPMLYPLRNAVGLGQGFRGLASEVRADDAAYGRFVHGMSPFMGNHDIDRYATYIEGCDNWQLFGGCQDLLAQRGPVTVAQQALIDELALSWAFIVTQPGVPLLYYGDEIGLAGANDPDNRRMMPWTRSQAEDALLDRFRKLAQARRDLPALQTGDRRELWVDDDLYVYARYQSGQPTVIVALAMGGGPQTAHVPIPTALNLEGRTLTDHMGSAWSGTVSGGYLDVSVTPWQPQILVPGP